MAFKDKLPKHGLKLFGFLVIFGIFCGVIYILARFMSPSHRCRPPSTPLALQPIIHFRPIVENVQTVTLKWQSQKVVNGSEFVTYNPSTNNFIVEESNILNIRMTFHVDIKHLTEDKLNVACLVYSDEKQKCKAVLFRKGHNMGELHVQDKIFALPGYKFSVSILDPSMINTNSHGNSLIVVKSFDSGHEVNNSTAKCKDKDKIS